MQINMEIRQKISNHPVIDGLEREVVVYRVADNMDVRQVIISARVEHFKQIDNVRTLLPEFTYEVKNWVISNDYQIRKRDNQNQVILDENDKPIKLPAFDAYQEKIIQVLSPLLQAGILNDDVELKRFG